MVYQESASFFGGVGFALSIASPIEWGIHKHLLHATPNERRRMAFIENASKGHNDKHHGAYKGPAHYYRDITNEHEVIHFSPKDVGIIAGIAGVVGFATDRAYCALAGNNSFHLSDGAFIAGTVAGTMAYYGTYEFIHHYMHDIGKRRLAINRTLGDIMQGNKRDGNLRFSKPILDTICNTVEFYIDEHRNQKRDRFYFEPFLINNLEEQTRINRENSFKTNHERAAVAVAENTSASTLNELTVEIIRKEKEQVSNMNISEKAKYLFERKIQRHLRRSEIFQYLDDHHFIHHFSYGSNLNVVFPLMDYIKRTKKDSSREELGRNQKYWLCPNSPDINPFSLPKPKASREEAVAAAA